MKLTRKLAIALVGLTSLSVVAAACSSSAEQFQPEAPAAPAPSAPAPEQFAPAPIAPQRPAQPEQPAPAVAAPTAAAAPSIAARDMSQSYEAAPPVGGVAPETPHRGPGDGYYPKYPPREPYDTTFFKNYGVNPFVDTRDDYLSTFAMDVDTASYTVARRFIMDGYMPDPDAVRVEEFINYFDQGYQPPVEDAFAIQIEGAPSPFGEARSRLIRVGIQGRQLFEEERKDATLIFVIDTSGSMGRENRLGLVKRSLHLLVDELRSSDEVGIVTYGTRGHVLLEPTSAQNRRTILNIIDSLHPDGSTNAEEGLTLGYDLAIGRAHPDRITRVILLSDGVANVGRTGPDAILRRVRHAVEEGVTLSTVGVGMGNYNDILMERLANDGNGNYAYVDTDKEAHRIFKEDLTGTLQVIARDAKIQVEFNPAVVAHYRLLGYENRDVADQDFRNDSVDAGEVGAGHSVTALYEVALHDEFYYEDMDSLAATVFVRYEDPDTAEVTELNEDFFVSDFAPGFEAASPRFQLTAAVAQYAEILRDSPWTRHVSLSEVLRRATAVHSQIPYDEEVAEFVSLISKADRIAYSRHYDDYPRP